MKNANNNKPIWRIARTIALLPLISFIWLIGWTLYWVGDQKQSAPNENTDAFKTIGCERKNVNETSQILA